MISAQYQNDTSAKPRLMLVSNNPNHKPSRKKFRANLRVVVSNKREKVA